MKISDLIRQERQKTPTPGPAAIRDALAEQGHSVEVAYIKTVLWRDRQPKKPRKKRSGWQRHYPKKGSKSAAIRSLLDDDPEMATSAVVAELDEQGINVSANLVNVVRHDWRRKRAAEMRWAEFADGPPAVGSPKEEPDGTTPEEVMSDEEILAHLLAQSQSGEGEEEMSEEEFYSLFFQGMTPDEIEEFLREKADA